MKRWVLSGIGYLLLVIVGYSIYTQLAPTEVANEAAHSEQAEHEEGTTEVTHETESSHEESASHEETASHEGNEDGHDDGHGDHGSTAVGESEVNVDVQSDASKIMIKLTDLQGQPVEDLEISHEKILHLIVVDDHLDQYLHLHPEEVGPGEFAVDQVLNDGEYKAFIDIKPVGKDYIVNPVRFTVGEKTESHGHASLEADTVFKKTVNHVEVNFNPSSLNANEEVTLTFSFPEGTNIEPYLGAAGHVVILDETANKYIHVHPLNENETIFATTFPEAGKYKLWGEFQINGVVHTYPFVVDVK